MFSLLFSSCGKPKRSLDLATVQLSDGGQWQDVSLLLSHIKQQDIPVPVGFSLLATGTSGALCYSGDLSVDQSIIFYRRTMEFNGWEIEDFSDSNEGLLVCNKSNKRCAISIRPAQISSKSTDVRVVLQDMKSPLQTCSDSINNKKITHLS